MLVYVEYGLDFDNNRWGIGKSIEIEAPDGTEFRTKGKITFSKQEYYFRLWIFKKVLIVSKNGVKISNKSRNNFKILFGIKGIKKG